MVYVTGTGAHTAVRVTSVSYTHLKWIALFAAAALALPLAAGCAGNGTGDMEAYRGRFEAAAVSRQLDSAEGITSGHILETEGDILVSVDYPVVANAPDISAELKAFAENKLAEFRASADAAHGAVSYTHLPSGGARTPT